MRRAPPVGPPRPHVDDGFAVQKDRKCASAVAGTGKHFAEGPYRTGEVRVGRALNTVRERRAALPAVRVLHNVSNLPATPANKPAVTDPLSHRMSERPRLHLTATNRVRGQSNRLFGSVLSNTSWPSSRPSPSESALFGLVPYTFVSSSLNSPSWSVS